MDAKEDNNVTTAVAITDSNNHQFDKPIDMPDLVKIEDDNAAPQLDLQLKNSEEVLQQIPLVVAEGTDQLEMITVQAEENTPTTESSLQYANEDVSAMIVMEAAQSQEESLAANEVVMTGNEVELATNDVEMAVNEVEMGQNEVEMAVNQVEMAQSEVVLTDNLDLPGNLVNKEETEAVETVVIDTVEEENSSTTSSQNGNPAIEEELKDASNASSEPVETEIVEEVTEDSMAESVETDDSCYTTEVYQEETEKGETFYIVDRDVYVESSKDSETSKAEEIEIHTVVQEDEADEEVEEPEPETKKPAKKLVIPNHVLGRNVQNPANEVIRNGRPPKPRIGVTVPHRNLTSQIVSKQDIAEVLMERQKARNSSLVYGSNTLFAKKLSKTLAKKLPIPTKKEDANDAEDLISILEGTEEQQQSAEEAAVKQPEAAANKAEKEEDIYKDSTHFVKHLEQELAKKQLSDLQAQRSSKRRRTCVELKPEVLPGAVKKQPENVRIVKIVEEQPKVVQKPPQPSPQPKRVIKEPEPGPAEAPNFKPNVPVKTYGRKWKTSEPITSVPPPPAVVLEADVNENQPSYPTKKSSRVIKRKIIWEPSDGPARYGAKIIKITDKSPPPMVPISRPQSSTSTPIPTAKQTEVKTVKKVAAAAAVVDNKPAITPVKLAEKSPKTTSDKGVKLREVKVAAISEKSLRSADKSPAKPEKCSPRLLAAAKKPEPPQSPNKTLKLKPGTPKKKLTEVDKLLMDEGAVNMLYAVKNEDTPSKKRKQTVISLDVVEKELRNKTNEILNDLQTGAAKISTISLRKKEPVTIKKLATATATTTTVPGAISRQKSKDSTRSSTQTPPASPVFHRAEASRIIRRRSSDSFSSDGEQNAKTEPPPPPQKEQQQQQQPVTQAAPEERVTRSKVVSEDKLKQNEELSRKFNKLVEDQCKIETVHYDGFAVKIFGNFLNVVLKEADKKSFLSVEVMKELCKVLAEAENNGAVSAILFTSDGSSFCRGIDYKALVADKEGAKKALAKEMAGVVKKFLGTLARCQKLLMCGLHGDVAGLGVTMLPLFDVVVASDSATFSAPYAQLGCVPEGVSLLHAHRSVSKALVSELLYSSRKLQASEALQIGLVTRVLCHTKFDEELLAVVKQISKQSQQFMVGTKKLLQRTLPSAEALLGEEAEVLVGHWISPECQKSFASYS